jgi:hypothetical protein
MVYNDHRKSVGGIILATASATRAYHDYLPNASATSVFRDR